MLLINVAWNNFLSSRNCVLFSVMFVIFASGCLCVSIRQCWISCTFELYTSVGTRFFINRHRFYFSIFCFLFFLNFHSLYFGFSIVAYRFGRRFNFIFISMFNIGTFSLTLFFHFNIYLCNMCLCTMKRSKSVKLQILFVSISCSSLVVMGRCVHMHHVFSVLQFSITHHVWADQYIEASGISAVHASMNFHFEMKMFTILL